MLGTIFHGPRHRFASLVANGGSEFVKCYYTRTVIPANIISLDAMGCEYGCKGYSSYSSFYGGQCCVKLHRCRRTSGDHIIPFDCVRGLLYTGALLKPSTKADNNHPYPKPKFYVDRVSYMPSITPSPATGCSCHRFSHSSGVGSEGNISSGPHSGEGLGPLLPTIITPMRIPSQILLP